DAECFGGGRDTHPVNRQALEDPAGDAVGELGSVIRAGQGCLEAHSKARSAVEPGDHPRRPHPTGRRTWSGPTAGPASRTQC
ncbi:hypothetical protein, partial [Corynebacterium diphtheriae]|uniref:hypothetical protein n=1 Tax=Corynebacterium diphtheriae TaxID=1717 RepID=UPI001A7EE76F